MSNRAFGVLLLVLGVGASLLSPDGTMGLVIFVLGLFLVMDG